MIDPRLIYGTTLAQGAVNPQALQPGVQQPGFNLGGFNEITTTTTHDPGSERKIIGRETRASMGSEEDAYQAKLTAMDEQAEADKAREKAQADNAVIKAEEAAKLEEKRQQLREAEDKRRAAESDRLAKSLDEYEKASKVTTLWEDFTPARRFLSAVATGLGAWAGTMSGTGRNGAYEIYRDQEETHRKTQEAQLKKATERVMAQTKSAEQAREYFKQGMESIDKEQIAKDKVMDLQLAAIEKAIPSAAPRAAIARAEFQAAYHDKKTKLLSGYDTTERITGTSVQTSSGDKSGGALANRKTEGEQKYAMLGSSMKAELNAITKGPALTEKDLQGIQANTLGSTAADKQAESSLWGSFIVGAGRWLDVIPKNRYDNLPQEKKVVLNAWDNAVEKYARILTGAGMPAEEARRMGLQNMPVAGDGQEAQRFKFDRLAREADFMLSLSNDAKAAIVKRLQAGDTLSSFMPEKETQQPAQPTGKVGSPNRVRGIPPAKQDAAATAADDYVEIVAAIRAKAAKLTPQEEAEFKEAYEAQKKAANAGSVDEEAARYMRQIRQRKGI